MMTGNALYHGRPREYHEESFGEMRIVQDGEFLDVVQGDHWLARFHDEDGYGVQVSMEEAWTNARIFVFALKGGDAR